jgi:large conductance mechanosensitive channel
MAQLNLKTLPPRPAWVEEFQSFILRGNVIDLAVGIIIGAAFTTIVSSLVKDIITPLLGLIVGGIDFSNIFLTLKGPHAATLAEAQKAGAVTVNVGVFLNAVINFLIISFAIFWLVKAVTKLHRKPDPAPPLPSASEMLLIEIRDLLRQRVDVIAAPAGNPLPPHPS